MAGAGSPPDVDFAMLLNQASYALGDRLGAALAETGVSVREYCALWKAGEATLTQRQLAQAAWMDEATLVATLDALTARGLAERHVAPHDRRVRTVAVTADGAAAVRRGHEAVHAVYEQVFAGVGARDRERFARVLLRLVDGALAEPFHMEPRARRRRAAR